MNLRFEGTRVTKGHLVFAVFLASVCLSAPARAGEGEGLDLQGLLSKPGVRLVVVEFYATWCKPCMEAAPRWRQLHERYRDRGLRLVAVSVEDQGTCAAPDWSPDLVICDDEGALKEAWGVDALPQAFLWSWQGHLLVPRGHVDQVEAAVEAWMERIPRVLVADPVDGQGRPAPRGPGIKRVVRAELSRLAKVEVVADQETRETLRQLRQEGHGLRYDAQSVCRLGEEIAPNSRLDITVGTSKNGERIDLEFFSLETGCLTAAAHAPVRDGDRGAAAKVAVARLTRELTGVDSGEGSADEARDDPGDPGAFTSVRFVSTPSGAEVTVDGRAVCREGGTPCTEVVRRGRRQVTMRGDGFREQSEVRDIIPGGVVSYTLQRAQGWLTVEAEPAGAQVFVNGAHIHKVPVLDLALQPGTHTVTVRSPCMRDEVRTVEIAQDTLTRLEVALEPAMGALKVVSVDEHANVVEAELYADGVHVDHVPGVVTLHTCTRKIRIQGEGREWSGPAKVQQEKTVPLNVVLEPVEPVHVEDSVPNSASPTAEPKRGLDAWYLNLFLGAFAGLPWGPDDPPGTLGGIGFSGGASMDIRVWRWLYVNTGLLFRQLNIEWKHPYISDGIDIQASPTNRKQQHLSYLKIPFGLQFAGSMYTKAPQNRGRYFVGLGGYLSFLLGHDGPLAIRHLGDVDGGVALDIGLSFNFGPFGGAYACLRGEIGLGHLLHLPEGDGVHALAGGGYAGWSF